jgi:hypothetical protein
MLWPTNKALHTSMAIKIHVKDTWGIPCTKQYQIQIPNINVSLYLSNSLRSIKVKKNEWFWGRMISSENQIISCQNHMILKSLKSNDFRNQ